MHNIPPEYLSVDPESIRHKWTRGNRGKYFWLQSDEYFFRDFLLVLEQSRDSVPALAVLLPGCEGSDDYCEKHLHWKRLSEDLCLSPAISDLAQLRFAIDGDAFLIFPSSRNSTELAADLNKLAGRINLFQRTHIILGPVEDDAVTQFWDSLDVLAPTLFIDFTFEFTLVTPKESILQAVITSNGFTGIEARMMKQSIEGKRKAWEQLGPESGPETCVEPGCDRLRIQRAIRCYGHQFDIPRPDTGG
jgi:hypothetical protein